MDEPGIEGLVPRVEDADLKPVLLGEGAALPGNSVASLVCDEGRNPTGQTVLAHVTLPSLVAAPIIANTGN